MGVDFEIRIKMGIAFARLKIYISPDFNLKSFINKAENFATLSVSYILFFAPDFNSRGLPI